ncbi:hypothetical protein FHS51_003159 [Sphingobium wenxiniae]|uniref:Uncharacterized protein n=1 Tax=Sphingobium wenxiniae (strain DSM 21828 / CGMCC 1.7748 / JZ-1) TaxID=595605 RepID=A0A562KIT4_SPHWJ|nr:hypothetical protein [Sphingobium wenxiniae]MBB6192905.1 hypothetical protein [Sphingobium wenxiniae]TWH95286.1 hypothetical protein IQ35_01542 [Sphingobium wenxiniae]
MATMPELIGVLEQHRVDSGATLELFGRRLREANRITKGKRGRGAAHMTYLDAARMLIACAATDHPERAVDAEYVFSNLVRHSDMGTDADFPMTVPDAQTLDHVLAMALQAIGEGKVEEVATARWRTKFPQPEIPVSINMWLMVHRSHVSADLRLLDGRYIYHHPALKALTDSTANGTLSEVYKVATDALSRETHRFRTGKNLRAEFDAPLLRTVANLIAGGRQ